MSQYEYQVKLIAAKEMQELVYFCNPSGECSARQVPTDQEQRLAALLTEHGQQGWELIQLLPGREGLLGIWKRSR